MNTTSARQILSQISPVADKIRTGSLGENGAFQCILRAAFAKQYEFSQMALDVNSPEIQFAFCPFLRGLCEDIIRLRFLSSAPHETRNIAIEYITNEKIRTHIQKQSDFFSRYRPSQHILRIREGTQPSTDATQQKFDELRNAYGLRGSDWPKVKEMAKRSGLEDLYNFLYAVTSSTVHFSPWQLGRMGWGDTRSQTFEFSTRHATAYYCSFNRFYALYLFATFCTSFASTLECRQDLECHIEDLIQLINAEERWPESVTHEEMGYFENPFRSLGSSYVFSSDRKLTHSSGAHWEWA